jgi:hypothetical protein
MCDSDSSKAKAGTLYQRRKSNDNIALSYMNLDILAGVSVSYKRYSQQQRLSGQI